MKRLSAIVLLGAATFGLAGCGVRGDLDRPPPIFSSAPDEAARTPVDTAVEVDGPPARSADEAYYIDLGGEIPKSDPEADIDESGMGDVSPE